MLKSVTLTSKENNELMRWLQELISQIADVTNERRLAKLILLLERAEQMASQYSGGYSGSILSAEQFHSMLKQSIARLKAGEKSELHNLWLWFAPTCAWDDFIGSEGMNLGNDIFALLDKLVKR